MDYVHERFLSEVSLDAWQLQDLNADSLMEAKLEMFLDFRTIEVSFRELTSTFQVPKDWVLLARTTVLLMGLCTHLNPAMNPVHTIRPYLEETVLGPEKDWKALLGSIVKEVALAAVALPEEMHRLLVKANRGELEVRVRGLQERTNLLYALGHQFLYSLFALGTGTLAYLGHARGDATLALFLAAAGGFFTLCLGVSFLRARKWKRRKVD